MTTEVQQLEGAIRILEARRGLLGDAVVDTMVAPARPARGTCRRGNNGA
jgi:hypothetical protein